MTLACFNVSLIQILKDWPNVFEVATGTAAQSPYVLAMTRAGIKGNVEYTP